MTSSTGRRGGRRLDGRADRAPVGGGPVLLRHGDLLPGPVRGDGAGCPGRQEAEGFLPARVPAASAVEGVAGRSARPGRAGPSVPSSAAPVPVRGELRV